MGFLLEIAFGILLAVWLLSLPGKWREWRSERRWRREVVAARAAARRWAAAHDFPSFVERMHAEQGRNPWVRHDF